MTNPLGGPDLISFDALRTFAGYKRPAEVRKWLVANRIGYLEDKDGRPVTTLQAINTVLIDLRQAGYTPNWNAAAKSPP